MTFQEIADLLASEYDITVTRSDHDIQIDRIVSPSGMTDIPETTLSIGSPSSFRDCLQVGSAVSTADIPAAQGGMCIVSEKDLLDVSLRISNLIRDEQSIDKTTLAQMLRATAEHQHPGAAINSFDVLTGNPLVLVDAGMNILVHSKSLPMDTPVWKKSLIEGRLCDELTHILTESCRTRNANHSTSLLKPENAPPMLVSSDIDQNRNGCHVIMVADRSPVSDIHWMLLPLICRHMLWVCNNEPNFWIEKESVYNVLLFSILDDDNAKPVLEKAIADGLSFSEQIRVLTVEFVDKTVSLFKKRSLMAELKQIVPLSYSVLYNNYVVFLVENDPLYNEEQARRLILEYNACLGISNRFSSPFSIREAYEQSLAAIRFAFRKTPEAGIYHYKNYFFDDLLSNCGAVNLEKFVLPEIYDLYRYDQKNGTALCRALKIYLQNGCSVNAAAKAAFVHKNTLLYRIHRIEDLTGFNFSDRSLTNDLPLSLRIFEHLHPDAFNEG